MEFPDLGRNCMKEGCNDLDFLPIKCHYCQLHFCSKHFLPADHQCSNYKSVERSQDGECCKIEKYECSVSGCKKYEMAPVLCNFCSLQICLSHRHQQDHKCSKYVAPEKTMTATKAVVKEILESNKKDEPQAPKKLRSVKAQRTAAKVQLMKLKMKSCGNKSLPQEERAYFLVAPPKRLSKAATGVWVSSSWVIGKVVDAIADILSVPNFNNAGDKEKLKLFRSSDGNSICEELSVPIRTLFEKEELFNGDNLIMEYVEDNTSFIIMK